MPTKPNTLRSVEDAENAGTKHTSSALRTIQADAFDDFIEEQLKKERSKDDSFIDGIVRHAY